LKTKNSKIEELYKKYDKLNKRLIEQTADLEDYKEEYRKVKNTNNNLRHLITASISKKLI
jgi:hypothetical protein